ncbi:MAG: response regulator [Phycisphaerae bacterium]|jgi:CheY-like chemotaxis protein
MSDGQTSGGAIIVLASSHGPPADTLDQLKALGEVVVEGLSSAAAIPAGRPGCRLLAMTPADFAEVLRISGEQQVNALLEAIGQGVVLFDANGREAWSNSRLNQFPTEVRERVRKYCTEGAAQGPALRPRSMSLVTEGDQYFDVTITPLSDAPGEHRRVVAVISDVTRARRLQRKMDAIDNAGRELVSVDPEQLSKMDARGRLELLERKILRYTRELLQFNNFAIRLLDRSTNKLELVLCAGYPTEAQLIDISASTEHQGISGYVAATGRSYICPDTRNDPRYLRGIDNARSSLTVPLRLHDRVIGVFNIESDKVAAFTEEDRQFAEIFGRYVGVALQILDLLVLERHVVTDRLADNVTAEIAGPLGEILADASTLMEEYIGHDDLRHRLAAITENVVKIKESIKQVIRPTGGLLGAKPKPPQADPVLADKTILVIDDEEVIRLAVCDVLTKHGARVEVARDGAEALAMIRQRVYELVITDIRMPGFDGYKIFAAVKDLHPECPVIFMTGFGYDPNHSIIKARQEGLSGVLFKPFKVDQLLADVRAALTGSAKTSQ